MAARVADDWAVAVRTAAQEALVACWHWAIAAAHLHPASPLFEKIAWVGSRHSVMAHPAAAVAVRAAAEGGEEDVVRLS